MNQRLTIPVKARFRRKAADGGPFVAPRRMAVAVKR